MNVWIVRWSIGIDSGEGRRGERLAGDEFRDPDAAAPVTACAAAPEAAYTGSLLPCADTPPQTMVCRGSEHGQW